MTDFFDFIKTNKIEFINFRFTDLLGEQKQISRLAESTTEELLKFGVTIDGSSIKGWKNIDNSDILLRPDLESFYWESYAKHKTVNLICDVIDTETGQNYICDPRSIAKKSEEVLKFSGVADKIFCGPELEFFAFDSVSHHTGHLSSFHKINSAEAEELSCDDCSYPRGKRKGYYDSVSPLDRLTDLRTQILIDLAIINGMEPTIHHHEVGNDQCEIGFQYGTLTEACDKVEIAKHVIKVVADSQGKLATFMPKPFRKDAGSGMHCHISLFKDGENLFHGDKYHNLSETALFFIGGVAKHIGAICAFTNQTTNSYKRLRPGFEAPVVMSYSRKNRSTAIRIPYSNIKSSKETRIECRFPDPSANPYLAFSAILMAGLDGILNKIHPGEATDFNLYLSTPDELKNSNFLPRSLSEALESLENDNEFLKRGGVFSDCLINSFLSLKHNEVDEISSYPSAIEFEYYLNC